jgi:hypothetical protein
MKLPLTIAIEDVEHTLTVDVDYDYTPGENTVPAVGEEVEIKSVTVDYGLVTDYKRLDLAPLLHEDQIAAIAERVLANLNQRPDDL